MDSGSLLGSADFVDLVGSSAVELTWLNSINAEECGDGGGTVTVGGTSSTWRGQITVYLGDYSDRVTGPDSEGNENWRVYIMTRGGNDIVYGGTMPEFIDLWTGNDQCDGGGGDDVILGYDGNDELAGGDGDDEIRGEAGDDYLDGWTGHDSLYGGDDNDLILGYSGDDYADGGDGTDDIYTESGDDTCRGGGGYWDYCNGGHGTDDCRYWITMDSCEEEVPVTWPGTVDPIDGGSCASHVLSYGQKYLPPSGPGLPPYETFELIVCCWDNAQNRYEIVGTSDEMQNPNVRTQIIGSSYFDQIYMMVGEPLELCYTDETNYVLFGQFSNLWDTPYEIVGLGGHDLIECMNDFGSLMDGMEGLNCLVNAGWGGDYVYGGPYDDDLRGKDDNDHLYGNDGDDSLSGEAGTDQCHGHTGTDDCDSSCEYEYSCE
jgi:Ca2+-binding RTX toxin-like protein